MSIETVPAPPAGWFADPTDPSGNTLRWWNGQTWTEHIHPAYATPQLQPRFMPSSAFAQSGTPYDADHLTEPAAADLSRARVTTAIGLTLAIVAAVVLSGTIFVRAFYWAPVLPAAAGIVLASIAVHVARTRIHAKLARPVVALVLSILVLVGSFIAPLGAMGLEPRNEGNSPMVFHQLPEMTSMAKAAFIIERAIRSNHSPGSWPTSFSSDSDGIVMADGVQVGSIEPGERASYVVTKDGQDFVLTIYGRDNRYYIYYDYDTHQITTWCPRDDPRCRDVS